MALPLSASYVPLLAPQMLAVADTPPASILVSRQLLESQHLEVGEVVELSADPSGAGARSFGTGGSYEPTPDPARLGDARLEARLHLPDLVDLTGDHDDPL